ncbi:hypothetical protein CPB85DRAFT_1307643 [Mucidula mucida]|nr:hypothetical protein CPB85DRAFT_1307643 [Mucidula mucida]
MGSPSVTLDEITTDPNSSKLVDFDFLKGCLEIDELEYALGLERGGLDSYRNNAALMGAKVHSDMQEFRRQRAWALLPSTEILGSLFDLFTHNREALTPDGRVLFTDHLPVAEYTYQLLPPAPRKSEPKPVYIRGTRYDPPHTNLPLIRANVHPALAFCALMDYVMATYNASLGGCPLIDAPLRTSINRLMRLLLLPVPITWIHGTWKEFQHRGIIAVTTRPKQPPREETPPIDDRCKTPEERDYKHDHPLVLKQQDKEQKYMREHNERSTALAKGKASDIKKHHFLSSTVVTTVDVQSTKRARSPLSSTRTEPVEEPPAKRSKVQTKKGGRKKSSTGSTPNPLPLRRSTRKPSNPPRYT